MNEHNKCENFDLNLRINLNHSKNHFTSFESKKNLENRKILFLFKYRKRHFL